MQMTLCRPERAGRAGRVLALSIFCSTVMVLKMDHSPEFTNPSCLQATRASASPHRESHTVPQIFRRHISTRPSVLLPPPCSLISPSVQRLIPWHFTPASLAWVVQE